MQRAQLPKLTARMFLRTLVIALTLLSSISVMAHSGGTNANGCHTDHSTNDYHCHSARAEGAYERQMDGYARHNSGGSGKFIFWLLLISFFAYLFGSRVIPRSPPNKTTDKAEPPPSQSKLSVPLNHQILPKATNSQPETEEALQLTPEKPSINTQQPKISLIQLKLAINRYRSQYPNAKLLDSILDMETAKRVVLNNSDIQNTLNCTLNESSAIRMVVYAKANFTFSELKDLRNCLTQKSKRSIEARSAPINSTPSPIDQLSWLEIGPSSTSEVKPSLNVASNPLDPVGAVDAVDAVDAQNCESRKHSDDHEKYLSQDFIISTALQRKLSIEDAINVEVYGCWLTALETGQIPPLNDEQRNFLEVASGKLEPQNEIQASWVRFKKLRGQKIICVRCLGKGYYTDDIGLPETCPDCHGAGAEGLTRRKISAEGSY